MGDVHQLAREQVTAWLDRVDQARDAKLRSDLLDKHEADELRLTSADLRLSWDQFIAYADLLVSRLGDDDLAKLLIVAMEAEYLRGIGAAGIVSKLCGLPTLSDRRVIDRLKTKVPRRVKAELDAAPLDIARPYILEALRKGKGGRVKNRVDLLTRVRTALTIADEKPISERTLSRWLRKVKEDKLSA